MTDKQIYCDIETFLPGEESLVTGIRKGEITIMMSARQTGKSYYNQYAANWNSIMEPPFKKIGQAEVDGEPWYTVKCTQEVGKFIRGQSGKGARWQETIDTNWYVYADTFDVCEDIYLQLGLKYV
jgi:hypothetical protein